MTETRNVRMYFLGYAAMSSPAITLAAQHVNLVHHCWGYIQDVHNVHSTSSWVKCLDIHSPGSRGGLSKSWQKPSTLQVATPNAIFATLSQRMLLTLDAARTRGGKSVLVVERFPPSRQLLLRLSTTDLQPARPSKSPY